MAAKKKINPRNKFIICRVTRQERLLLEERAMYDNMDFSAYLRKLLGFNELND